MLADARSIKATLDICEHFCMFMLTRLRDIYRSCSPRGKYSVFAIKSTLDVRGINEELGLLAILVASFELYLLSEN